MYLRPCHPLASLTTPQAHHLRAIMSRYRQWADELFPPAPFSESIRTIEQLGLMQKCKVGASLLCTAPTDMCRTMCAALA